MQAEKSRNIFFHFKVRDTHSDDNYTYAYAYIYKCTYTLMQDVRKNNGINLSTSAAFYVNTTQILFTCFASLWFMYILEKLTLPGKEYINI